jgi:hypothetical protein
VTTVQQGTQRRKTKVQAASNVVLARTKDQEDRARAPLAQKERLRT